MKQLNYMAPRQQDIIDRVKGLREEANKEAQSETPNKERIAKIKMEEMLQSMKMNPLYGKNSIRPW